MRFFVSSADRTFLESVLTGGFVSGVTTNPTVLRRDGVTARQIPELTRQSLSWGAQEVHHQTYSDDAAEMIREGHRLAEIDPNRVVVRLPGTLAGYAAAVKLVSEGVRIDMTAVFTLRQVLVADSIGVGYVTIYIGRMRETGLDGLAQISQIRQLVAAQKSEIQIIGGNIRDPLLVDDLGARGIHCVTLPPFILERVLDSPSTLSVVHEFRADADAIMDDIREIGGD